MSRIREQIKFHEGEKKNDNGNHIVYKDHLGIDTVGYGHMILETDPENNLEVGDEVSQERVNELFEQDLAVCSVELQKHLPYFQDLDDVRQRCLIDLTFNMGMPRLRQFVKTLEHFRNNRFEEASVELLDSRYARQVGKRAERIAEMIRTGEDSKDF
tara:strand:+ start:206 stop:676 length:471 start_codon:yes stop_codon:yes gene_type:complete